MTKINKAKKSIDDLIKKSRVHFYKPVQIAEILYRDRMGENVNMLDLESYRNVSKKWRDDITMRLVGRVSTSSQKFQDNIFDKNAIPPETLQELSEINKMSHGGVEAYIYLSMQEKLSELYKVADYLKDSTPSSFNFTSLIDDFTHTAGLKRSIDKVYEISIHALFSTIVRALGAEVTFRLKNTDKQLLVDFREFITKVLNLNEGKTEITMPAGLYRVGVTNAADRGLDMWSNFGPVVQVKHLTLKAEMVEEIAEGITADRIVIVCLDAEKEAIETLLSQVGWSHRIQGIVTLTDLINWYETCLNDTYRDKLGDPLLEDLRREFRAEFPSYDEFEPFLEQRNYSSNLVPNDWQ